MKDRAVLNGGVRSSVESLEGRRLLSATLGTNLVVNPGAETYAGTANGGNIITPTGWTRNGNATVAAYTYSPSTLALPPGAGAVRFIGGPNSAESDFFQTIDLTPLAPQIDAGTVKFNLSAYLGGVVNQGDNATVFANFNSPTNGLALQSLVGPVSAANTGNQTGLVLRSATGTVPKTVRSVQIQIHFERTIGTYDEAQADNLSLVLTGPATGTIAGTVFNDANGDGVQGAGEGGLAGARVFLDANNNGVQDAGEAGVTTTATGAYAFGGLATGSYVVREVAPAGFRVTTADPLSVAVNGATVAGRNFGNSQTVLISGSVFDDANGDGLLTTGEPGLAGVKVFIDRNNNGIADAGEAAVTTAATGAYAFAPMAPGTYVVREVVPATYRATTANPLSVAVASGGVATGKTFGDSQTVLITGTVFKDANGNKVKDAAEVGIANVTVYLDFNNNGRLDPAFELKAVTNAAGVYSFVLPFGTYTVRQVLPAGYTTQTVAPVTLTLPMGAVSVNDNFGDK